MNRFDLPIVIKKDDLLAQLYTNRAEHRSIFVKAIERYRIVAVEMLQKRIDDIKAVKSTDTYVHLPVPEDHTDDYDRAIRMLERHQLDTVDLTEATYRQFMDDDWDWKERWAGTTASYVSG